MRHDEALYKSTFTLLYLLGLDIWDLKVLGLGLDHEAHVLGLGLGNKGQVLGLGFGF